MFQDNKCPPLWSHGPDVQSLHDFPNRPKTEGPKKVTQSPVTTGSSVLAMKYDGGVIMAADTLGSYGSLARFTEISRVLKVNDTTVIAAGGDYADFQFLSDIIKQKQIDEECCDDGQVLKPRALHCWLTRVLYNRRSKFDPLWNVIAVAGMQVRFTSSVSHQLSAESLYRTESLSLASSTCRAQHLPRTWWPPGWEWTFACQS